MARTKAVTKKKSASTRMKRKAMEQMAFSQVKRAREILGSFGKPSPLPKTLRVTMRYYEQFGLNPGIGTNAVYVFSGNGLYDPNITGAGHQPRGFDQLISLYDHYVVIGCHGKVSFATGTSGIETLVGVALRDSTVTEGFASGYIEGSQNKWTCARENGGNVAPEIEFDFNPNEFLGRSKPLSDPDLKGDATANPVEQCYLHIWAQSADSSSDVASFACSIELIYEAILIEPKNPSPS